VQHFLLQIALNVQTWSGTMSFILWNSILELGVNMNNIELLVARRSHCPESTWYNKIVTSSTRGMRSLANLFKGPIASEVARRSPPRPFLQVKCGGISRFDRRLDLIQYIRLDSLYLDRKRGKISLIRERSPELVPLVVSSRRVFSLT
jgi:hypothetical protein